MFKSLTDYPFARKLTPLAVKATMKIWAPLQWKGGQTVELYKGKLDRLLCGNFRDITLSDLGGKPYSSAKRAAYAQACQSFCTDAQTGSGIRRAGTDTGHMLVRSTYDISVP